MTVYGEAGVRSRVWNSPSLNVGLAQRVGESHVQADESHLHHLPTTPADLENLTSHTDTTQPPQPAPA
ncbi:MAG: hypothetical protein JWQ81_2927 [Amycolatopsis sp.]|uniref:hypothetical protein n=1 Tax=Amycolatopsis sp. TaxID=37632 RepID=UPI00261CF921|nr:hypothetical protein [Amycolatopsis sp.]MCU1682188.1 hypothetical protein [Amycolatopsis sp.]